MIFWSLLPIIVMLVLLLVLRWPLFRVAPVSFFLAALVAISIWHLSPTQLIHPMGKGLLLALDICLIISGALCFNACMKVTGHAARIATELNHLTENKQELVLLFAWLFGSFIEAVAGFGTPGAIVAPFMLSIGLPPLKSVVIALLANSTAVTFGAVGTPLRLGMADYLYLDFLTLVPIINLLPCLFVPFAMLYILHPSNVKSHFFSGFLSGIFFFVPYGFGTFLGLEYPSLLGGGVGFVGMLAYLGRNSSQFRFKYFLTAFSPYFFLVAILFVGKFLFAAVNFTVSLGDYLSHTIQFFNPGFAFLTLIGLMYLRHSFQLKSLVLGADSFLPTLAKTFSSILFVGALTYLMVLTDNSGVEGGGMFQVLARSLMTPFLLFYSAAMGAFGSFLAGSATVSNLLLAPLQFIGARDHQLDISLILVLQLTGAAAGNMIALPNILAIKGVVNFKGSESQILKLLVLPCLIYLFLATSVAFLLS